MEQWKAFCLFKTTAEILRQYPKFAIYIQNSLKIFDFASLWAALRCFYGLKWLLRRPMKCHKTKVGEKLQYCLSPT